MRDQQEILQLASVAPMVLDTALKETWGNKRIKSPTRFILSRMRQASFRIGAGNAVLTI